MKQCYFNATIHDAMDT